MRYIRTKDGIYLFNDIRVKLTTDYINEKVADTIEELCDEFIYVTNNGNHYIKNNHNAIHFFYENEKPIDYYGAIWTDKGLIYVAKMNKEGELELL